MVTLMGSSHCLPDKAAVKLRSIALLQESISKNNIEPGKGAYILWLQSGGGKSIEIGKLATMTLQQGLYCYVGSAMGPGGVRARVGHHSRFATRPRWHIDYLRAECSLIEVWYAITEHRVEHDWVAAMAALPGASQPAPGFGASDHRGSTHLFRFGEIPQREAFIAELRRQSPDISVALKVRRI